MKKIQFKSQLKNIATFAAVMGATLSASGCGCDDLKQAQTDLLTIKAGIARGLKDPASWEASCFAMKRSLINFAQNEQKLADISNSSCKDNPSDATCELVIGMTVNTKVIQKQTRYICDKVSERSINGQDPENSDDITGRGRSALKAVRSLEDKILAAQITNKCKVADIQEPSIRSASTDTNSSYRDADEGASVSPLIKPTAAGAK